MTDLPPRDPPNSGPSKPGIDPESLVLRPQPRRVVRFKRRVVIGIVAIASIAIFGAAWIALNGTLFRQRVTDQELYNTERKPMADALSGLPKSYDQLAKPPKLGAPLPGDLGPPVVDEEKKLGVIPPSAPNAGLRPNPEDEAERAERMRLAQQARQAREAGVFFQLTRSEEGPGANATNITPVVATGQGSAPATTPPLQTAAAPSDRLNLDLDKDQNDQQRKLDFLNQPSDRNVYNQHALQDPVSPYEVLAGTVISASLITGINSDLPGEVLAQVTANIFDSVTGRTLLIPQGSKLIGTYDSVVAFGQSRALVIWQRIVMPDGSSIVIDNLPATDTAGYSGLADEVDYHTWRLLEGIGLSTLLGTGSQITFGNSKSDLVQAIRESTQDSVNQAGQRVTERNLNIQPTITVRPGWPVRVVVHKDLVLRPYRD
jgi:type IV secretory pathway VirB10-like protein